MSRLSSVECFFTLVWLALMSVTVRATDAAAMEKTINFSFTLQNTTGNLLEEGDFWVYGPVAETSHQRCLSLEASHGFELQVDDLGNQILHFKIVGLPPFATKIIRIKANLEIRTEGVRLSVSPDRFLRSEPLIEMDSPLIVQQAARLKAEDDLTTARRIHQWVAGTVMYGGFSGVERGALYALEQRRGDCSEFRDLFVALARAAGIPARQAAGYPLSADSSTLKPAGFHDWAEFLHDGVWLIADPQKSVFADMEQDYVAFKIFGDQPPGALPTFSRFLVAGEGLQARMNY
jgi:transglutaminase-like putative cysteine protease